jgi:hypothetical protein
MGRKFNKGILVHNGKVYIQDWRDGEENQDESDKAIDRGTEICTEEDLQTFTSGNLVNVDIEGLIRRSKRGRSEEDFPRQAKKKKASDNNYHR